MTHLDDLLVGLVVDIHDRGGLLDVAEDHVEVLVVGLVWWRVFWYRLGLGVAW